MKDVSTVQKYSSSGAKSSLYNAFLQGFEGNPFARVRCRAFMRLCTGVCGSCKKERDEFKLGRLIYWQKYFEMEGMRSGGDPDMIENHLNPESILESEIFIITAQKEERFIHEYLPQVIQEVTQERIVANLG